MDLIERERVAELELFDIFDINTDQGFKFLYSKLAYSEHIISESKELFII